MKHWRLFVSIWVVLWLVGCNQSSPQPTVAVAAVTPSVSIQSAENVPEGESLTVVADGRPIALSAETIPPDDVTFRWTVIGSGTLRNESSADVQYIAPEGITTLEEQIVITVTVTDRNGRVAKGSFFIRLVAPPPVATETLTPTPAIVETPTITADVSITPSLPSSSPLFTATPPPTATPTPTPVPTTTPRVLVLESFEEGPQMNWWSPDPQVFSYVPTGEQAFLGSQSFRINYQKTDTFQFVAFELSPDSSNFSWARTLRVWVYGDVAILLKLEDQSLNQADVAILDAANPNGWTQLSFNIQSVAAKLDLSKIRTVFFFIEPGDTTASGVIYFDSVALQE